MNEYSICPLCGRESVRLSDSGFTYFCGNCDFEDYVADYAKKRRMLGAPQRIPNLNRGAITIHSDFDDSFDFFMGYSNE